MALGELLLLLDTPTAYPNDLKQMVEVWMSSAERHDRFIPRSARDRAEALKASAKDAPKTAARHPSSSFAKRRLADAFASDGDVDGCSTDQGTLDTDSSAYEAPPRKIARHWQDQPSASSSDMSPPEFAFRMAVPVNKLNRTRRVEDTSLMTIDYQRDTHGLPPSEVTWHDNRMRPARTPILYTLNLNLMPNLSLDPDLASYASEPYKFAIDTGDCSVWCLEEGFRMYRWDKVEADWFVEDWPKVADDPLQRHACHAVLPPGDFDDVQDAKKHKYSDGPIFLSRWSDKHDVCFRAPSWSWTLNDTTHRSVVLRIPRILARTVPEKFGTQSADGNFGMAAPGWREPWGNEVGSEDRLTFWDILEGVVETPSQAMIRFLVPDGRRLARASKRVQSFLYCGKGIPCGFLQDEKLHLPKFGPPLRIFTAINSPGEYQHWQLQLCSISLLEPVSFSGTRRYDPVWIYDPRSISPEEWVEKRIDLSDSDKPGIRTVFDSGDDITSERNLYSAHVKQVWEEWFNQAESEMPLKGPLWHDRQDNFEHHDMLFEFKDSQGTSFTLRCGAENFLSSPWKRGRTGKWSLLASQSSDVTDEDVPTWVLGMNFFWANIIKLNGQHRGDFVDPAQGGPTMQFAAQRIVHDGQIIADTWKLQLHADLPPRLEAMRLGGNEELYPHEPGVVF